MSDNCQYSFLLMMMKGSTFAAEKPFFLTAGAITGELFLQKKKGNHTKK